MPPFDEKTVDLAPRRMVENFAVEPIGTAGLSPIRSIIGEIYIASVAMLASGPVTGQTLGFVAVALLLGVVAFGRLVSVVTDGFDKAVISPLVAELVIIAVLLTAHAQLSA